MFWTTFGQYMRPVPFANEGKLSWVNYRTGVRHLYFRMEVMTKSAEISIEMVHPDEGMNRLMLEQFLQFKSLLHATLEEEWIWEEGATCRIYTSLEQVNYMNEQTWPQLISFFKPRMIALDEFWSSAKYAFEIFAS